MPPVSGGLAGVQSRKGACSALSLSLLAVRPELGGSGIGPLSERARKNRPAKPQSVSARRLSSHHGSKPDPDAPPMAGSHSGTRGGDECAAARHHDYAAAGSHGYPSVDLG